MRGVYSSSLTNVAQNTPPECEVRPTTRRAQQPPLPQEDPATPAQQGARKIRRIRAVVAVRLPPECGQAGAAAIARRRNARAAEREDRRREGLPSCIRSGLPAHEDFSGLAIFGRVRACNVAATGVGHRPSAPRGAAGKSPDVAVPLRGRAMFGLRRRLPGRPSGRRSTGVRCACPSRADRLKREVPAGSHGVRAHGSTRRAHAGRSWRGTAIDGRRRPCTAGARGRLVDGHLPGVARRTAAPEGQASPHHHHGSKERMLARVTFPCPLHAASRSPTCRSPGVMTLSRAASCAADNRRGVK